MNIEQQIQAQSHDIERVFAEFSIDAQIVDGIHHSDRIQYNIWYPLEQGLGRLQQLKERLKQVLGAPDVSVTREQGQLRVELLQPTPPPAALTDVYAAWPQMCKPFIAPLGVSDSEQPVALDLAGELDEHVLITGGSRSGKTSLLRSIGLSLGLHSRQSQVQLLVIDPQQRQQTANQSLQALNHLPHLLIPAVRSPRSALHALNFLVDEVAYRQDVGRRWPRIVVLIDGLELLAAEEPTVFQRIIGHLLQHGSEAGVQLVTTLNADQADILDRRLMSHFTLRLIGRVANATLARQLSGMRDSGAEQLTGYGDFTAVAFEQALPFQAAYIDAYTASSMVFDLQRRLTNTLLAKPLQPISFSSSRSSADRDVVTPKPFTVDGMSGDVVLMKEPAFQSIPFGGD